MRTSVLNLHFTGSLIRSRLTSKNHHDDSEDLLGVRRGGDIAEANGSDSGKREVK